VNLNPQWTLSALQLHSRALIVVDEDATAGNGHLIPLILVLLNILASELHVKTVKYFKSIERVQDEVDRTHAELRAITPNGKENGGVRATG
jgi:glucosamine-6-phosphate deaminase